MNIYSVYEWDEATNYWELVSSKGDLVSAFKIYMQIQESQNKSVKLEKTELLMEYDHESDTRYVA